MKVLLLFVSLLSVIYSTTAVDVPNVKLNNDRYMPQIGLGTWKARGEAGIQAVKDALEIGYRHIDTAFGYFNEKEVGEAVHQQINAGVVKREDLFITSKVWPSGSNQQKALAAVKKSLERLNLTYLDLVLVHFPREDWVGMYKGLEDAYNQKLVRSIGVSNFDINHLDQLIKSVKIMPTVNQIEVHPGLNQDQNITYCNKLGISVTGYCPLGNGRLVKDTVLTQIGKKHNKTASQVAIRWQIQRGLVVIPKSTHKAYIKENFEVFDFELSSDEMKTIHKMDFFRIISLNTFFD